MPQAKMNRRKLAVLVVVQGVPPILTATEPGDTFRGATVDRSSILRTSTKKQAVELGFYNQPGR